MLTEVSHTVKHTVCKAYSIRVVDEEKKAVEIKIFLLTNEIMR